MRSLAALIVFVSSLVAAVVVIVEPAEAGWSAPASLGKGETPAVRFAADHHYVALLRDRAIHVRQDGRAHATVRIPRAGDLAAFDIDADGTVVALRVNRRRKQVLALVEGAWRRISARGAGTPVDAQLSVAESGAALATWLEYERGTRRIRLHAAVRGPNARRFLPAQRISGTIKRGGNPISIDVDDAGDAVVAFAERRDLFMWRLGRPPVRIHDATDVVAGAFASAAGVHGGAAVVAWTRLEDLEPPRYRATAAVTEGDAAPAISTVAADVSAIDVHVTPQLQVLTAPIGPPHRIDAWPSARSWPAAEAPSSVRGDGAAVTWTEGISGFAASADEKLDLGRAYTSDVAADRNGRAIVAWDSGPARPVRYAVFTP